MPLLQFLVHLQFPQRSSLELALRRRGSCSTDTRTRPQTCGTKHGCFRADSVSVPLAFLFSPWHGRLRPHSVHRVNREPKQVLIGGTATPAADHRREDKQGLRPGVPSPNRGAGVSEETLPPLRRQRRVRVLCWLSCSITACQFSATTLSHSCFAIGNIRNTAATTPRIAIIPNNVSFMPLSPVWRFRRILDRDTDNLPTFHSPNSLISSVVNQNFFPHRGQSNW